jgi:hypothetical protein
MVLDVRGYAFESLWEIIYTSRFQKKNTTEKWVSAKLRPSQHPKPPGLVLGYGSNIPLEGALNNFSGAGSHFRRFWS